MKFVFGPVPSRRLGQSLGVDTIPLKTCNWNCVYCQLGRTIPLTNARREYFPRQDILAEVETALAYHRPGEINWLTFVGSGEPTLYSELGWLISAVKSRTELPVAVITNGALFYLPEVRQEVALADAVLPSLDAGTASLYRRINRPHADITFDRLLEGLILFRDEFSGKLWVEVMLVRGLNDRSEDLHALAACLRLIKPDQVHINFPRRPPAETWVLPPDEAGLRRAHRILGDIACLVQPAAGAYDLSGEETIAQAIIAIITRHPMREEELIQTLEGWSHEKISAILLELHHSGKAQVVERLGTRFWSAASSQYPDDEKSQYASPSDLKRCA